MFVNKIVIRMLGSGINDLRLESQRKVLGNNRKIWLKLNLKSDRRLPSRECNSFRNRSRDTQNISVPCRNT